MADALVFKKVEGQRAEEISNEDPASPKIGRWYGRGDCFTIAGIDEEGRRTEDKRFVMNVHMNKFEVDASVPSEPPEPKEEEKEEEK